MRKYSAIVFTSILVTSLIMPSTSYASNIQSTYESNKNLSVMNLIFSMFHGSGQTMVTGSDTTTLNTGDKNIPSKETDINNNRFDRDHDHDHDGHRDHPRDRDRECDKEREHDHPKESKDIWRDWYCNGDWDWFWYLWN